jgi:hypothetical protein
VNVFSLVRGGHMWLEIYADHFSPMLPSSLHYSVAVTMAVVVRACFALLLQVHRMHRRAVKYWI